MKSEIGYEITNDTWSVARSYILRIHITLFLIIWYWSSSQFYNIVDVNYIFTKLLNCLISNEKGNSIIYLRLYQPLSSWATKIKPQAKLDNFAFKNSKIIIEGLFWNQKDYFPWKKFETQKNNFINKFYFCPKFCYRFIPNFKKYAILINNELFFQKKHSPELHRFQFSKINSLRAKTVGKKFSKMKFL